MKNLIYTVALFLGFGIVTIQAQDVSFTNTILSAPSNGAEYGQACFTIIAEEGLDLTSVPLAVEVSLSKVDFDSDGINGFNSQNFDWETDQFAPNVIRGTLTTNIPSVENGGGGAMVCIPVRRDFDEDYNDPRNGFTVNLIPGSHNQFGNTSNDYIEKFGFPNNSQTRYASITENKGEALSGNTSSDEIEVSVFPNPTSDFVNVKVTNTSLNTDINVYNSIGQSVYNGTCLDNISINTSQWTEGTYYIEMNDQENNVKSIKKVVVSK